MSNSNILIPISDEQAKAIQEALKTLQGFGGLFLDHIPIAIVISKLIGGDQRIVYANKAYEALTGQARADIRGSGWSVLDSFRLEDEPHLAFGDAPPKCDDTRAGRKLRKNHGQDSVSRTVACRIGLPRSM